MFPRVGVCYQIFNLNPIKKTLQSKCYPVRLRFSLKSYRPIFLVKVVQNASSDKFRRKRKQYILPIAVEQRIPVYSRPGLICLTIFLISSLKWKAHNKEKKWYTNNNVLWLVSKTRFILSESVRVRLDHNCFPALRTVWLIFFLMFCFVLFFIYLPIYICRCV